MDWMDKCGFGKIHKIKKIKGDEAKGIYTPDRSNPPIAIPLPLLSAGVDL